MDALVQLDPMAAAVKIASEIKGKAAEFFKATKLPGDPTEQLKGKGGQEGKRGPEGAKFY